MFTPIDQSTWPRREHFAYYRNTLPCANSVTTHLDVTKFRAMLQKNHIKFYPAFIWCVSHTLLSHPDFRLAVDQSGTLGTHDVLHPNYTVFHEDDHTFSDLWTAHDEDFPTFYRAFLADLETYGNVPRHEAQRRPALEFLLHLLRPLAGLHRLCHCGPRRATPSLPRPDLWQVHGARREADPALLPEHLPRRRGRLAHQPVFPGHAGPAGHRRADGGGLRPWRHKCPLN